MREALKIEKQNVDNILPLTHMQAGMLFYYLNEPDTEKYFEQLSLRIGGKIRTDIFRQAWNFVVSSNEMLRTIFRWDKLEKPVQIVLKEFEIPIMEIDISKEDGDREELIEKIRQNDRKTKLDIRIQPFRITLCKLLEDRYELIISNHHILYDGWSNGILIKEFFEAYKVLSNGGELRLHAKSSFKDFVEWYHKAGTKEQGEFWKEYLKGIDTRTPLPLDQNKFREVVKTNNYVLNFEKGVVAGIQAFIKERSITLATLFYSVWGILLQKYSNSDDVLFGITTSGRTAKIKNIESIVGLLINTIPLRIKDDASIEIGAFLQSVEKSVQEVMKHENTPLVDIVSYSEFEKRQSLFDSIMVVENYPLDKEVNEKGGDLKILSYSIAEMTSFDLTLGIAAFEDIELSISYNTDMFYWSTIEKMAGHFTNILSYIVENPNKKMAEIEVISEEEKHQILKDFNKREVQYPIDKTLHALFEEQVIKTPENIALVFDEQEITYMQLNSRANQLAQMLRDNNVNGDTIVAIITDTSPEMIIGILGILKAGGAYLPIDPDYPEERINHILEDSGTQFLVTQKHFEDKIHFTDKLIFIDSLEKSGKDIHNLEHINKPNDLAYVIYTSGSTGKPKGVMVEHGNAVSYIHSFKAEFNIMQKDVVLQQGTYCFDAFVEEMYPSLLSGGRMVMVKRQDVADVSKLVETMRKNRVTLISCSPLLLNEINRFPIVESLNTVISGGDVLKEEYISNLSENINVYNTYGPTESTVCITYYKVHEKLNGSIPIGKPISNYKVYILDRNNKLMPVGMMGELCVSGPGVSRGYLNNPKLTNDKFVDNPFEMGQRMYRTGDFARWLPDGNIEYLGRIDQQVKIRGFRIELGEIEQRLLALKEVEAAVVMDMKSSDGDKYLCAYIAGKREFAVSELREHLLRELPEYMVPSFFTQVERIPVTSSGKVDRKALFAMGKMVKKDTEYVHPETETELQLAEIWREVLQTENIGILDNFFELGGHSLKATMLASKIHKKMEVEVPLKEIFRYPTIKEIGKYIDSLGKNGFNSIPAVVEREYYPASSAQKRMFVLWQLEKDSTVYNMPGAMIIKGEVERNRIELALNALVERHEALRTSFEMLNGQPVQRIHRSVDFNMEYIDNKDGVKDVEEAMGLFVKPFDLVKAPLIRAALMRMEENNNLLMIDMHHIISDGISLEILIREFTQLYDGGKLPDLHIQYKDYAVWQQENLESRRETLKAREDYWLNIFSDEIPVLDLPLDYPRPSMQNFDGSTKKFTIGEVLAEKLRMLAEQTGSTMYMVLLGAYNILLSKYSRQEDIVVGTPIAGRTHEDLQNIMGMFVNTLAMRNYPQGNKSFRQFLSEVKETALGAYENQDYQLEDLMEKLGLRRDLSRNPLFDAMFILQNMDKQELKIGNVRITPYEFENKVSKFDITLTGVENEKEIVLSFEYCTRLLGEETIKRMAVHYINILEQVVENPDVQLSRISMISEAERQKILCNFNETATDFSSESTIHGIFEERVRRTPEAVALVYGNEQMSCMELNEKANRLARVLRSKGNSRDSIVGIMVDRSFEMIIGIMGILKAGCAYLPIDPEYPVDRIEFMLEDSGAKVLLTHSSLCRSLNFRGDVICLDEGVMLQGDPSNLEVVNAPSDLAYVIYTSGSTGKPKGVLVQHNSAVNMMECLQKRYPFEAADVYLLKTTYTFDVSVTEIFGWIFGQGRLVILEKDAHKSPLSILEAIDRYDITHINFVPSMFSIFVNVLDEKDVRTINKLKYIFVAGEAIQGELVRKFNQLTGKVGLENLYGPTEATIYATGYSLKNFEDKANVPIGRPLQNLKVYIVDPENNLQPEGVPGELCIAGVGVARGYLKRPELTGEKFVANPFNSFGTKEDCPWMYRTGDLARWLPDGNIEYLGRIDHQVKIRGFRIELGEIESSLARHESVIEAVVIDRKDTAGEKYLCAYVTANRTMSSAEFREHLSKELPEYMIPAYFVQLEKMPLNYSGKIDRKALPLPENNMNTGALYEAPENEIQRRLADLWQQILRVERVGIRENFFEIGGHSLKATLLASKIHKEMGVDIPLKEIFQRPTVIDQAKLIESLEKKEYIAIQPVEKREYYPASFSQRRLFILKQLEEHGTTYNLPGVMIVENNLDVQKLEKAIKVILKRHEALRTSFKTLDGEPVQIVHTDVDFCLECVDMEEVHVQQIVKEFVKPFDLEKAPLFRIKVLRVSEVKHIVMFDMHHIISDGVSMNVLLNELTQLYEERELPELKVHYKDYAVWQEELFKSGKIKKEEEYWLDVFSGELPVLNLPTDFARPAIQSFDGDRIYYELDEKLTERFNHYAAQTGITMFMLVLAAYNILFSKYSGQEDIIVGTPVAGRPHADLENIIGMFVNTMVIRSYPKGIKTVAEFLEEIKDSTLKVFENQNFQFDMLVDKLDLQRDLSRNPLFDVMLAFEDVDLADKQIGDLKVKNYDFESKISKFDLLLFTFQKGKAILFEFEYNTALFKRETVIRMLDHLVNIMTQMVENVGIKLSEIDMLSETERKKLLFDFNDTEREYPNATIHGLFEAQAMRTPDKTALMFGGTNLTYRELDTKAQELAKVLRSSGVNLETPVGIMMDKSLETVVGLMGILKAGGAYLPIDPGYPMERVLYMLEDSGAPILLTDTASCKEVPFTLLEGIGSKDAEIMVTKGRGHIRDFDSLPVPDRSLIDVSKYKNKIGMASVNNCISLQTTRGCPYLCLFCHKVWSKNHSFRSAENIYSEIEYYYKRGVVNFSILDDCFNLNAENGKRLFRMIIANKLKIKIFFPNGLRGDILTKDYIDLMVEAGVVNINLSLETASPRLQKLLKKYLNLDKFKEVVDYIATQHPHVILELATMHGFPTETEEEALMTLNFIKDIKWIHFPYIHILKVYPNTEMEEFALQSGVRKEDIMKSVNLAYHEIPETLPFPKSFTRKYQAEFLNEYFLSEERLRHVLPVQMNLLSEDAIIEKYSTYLPADIKSIKDILEFAGVKDFDITPYKKEEIEVTGTIFDTPCKPRSLKDKSTPRILFIDLSQHFSSESMLYKVYEQPLGQLYLLTYLNKQFGDKIDGRIYKSGVDFDSYKELKQIIDEYKPDLIGIRTLSLYKEFFHQTVSLLRQWGLKCPIITGGPYATSDYRFVLQDKNVDLVVFGEGELTLAEIVGKMLENDFKLPELEVLKEIEGIAFNIENYRSGEGKARKVLLMDHLDLEKADGYEKVELPSVSPDNLAYIMYTSGSTGKPKGVMIEHRHVNNCIFWMQDKFMLKEGDNIVQRTNLTFDPSVWEVFWPLYIGAGVKLLTIQQGKDAELLLKLMADDKENTMMYCPASLVTGMTYLLNTKAEKIKLKMPWFLIGAEPISVEVVKDFYSYYEGQIVNTYGPTECTINNTYYDLVRDDDRNIVPIGKPVSNNQIYILSKEMQMLPTNVPGEIYISGDSLARGYINNMEKTMSSFIKNPFRVGSLYRTGDIGKWLEDGNIEIMGRADNQVKIRGYRIELGEIESSLIKHPRVNECAVVVKDTKEANNDVKVCKKCGITSVYPDIVINEDSVCDICNNFVHYKPMIDDYFRDMDDLDRLLREQSKDKKSKYDCMVLYAGGIGSAHALYRLYEMGYNVLTATYDNGYFSVADFKRIKYITDKLRFDHIILSHENTEKIFGVSMRTASTVCKGCFFTSSSLAADYAYKHGIKVVIGATLSRGQIIENKLYKLFKQGVSETSEIERELSKIQRLTYEMNEEIFELIGIESVKDGSVYEYVTTLDFYRYCDISNEEMLNYLSEKDAYWNSRKNYAIYSTNCSIKQVGDFAHINDKKHHYYGASTSWEKRLGHISVENVKADLQCNITQKSLDNFLRKIKFEKPKKVGNLETKYICAYYSCEEELPVSDLREHLSKDIPEYMIPSYFMRLDRLPLTAEGKVNRRLLPEPEGEILTRAKYEAPVNAVEEKLVKIWKEVLGVNSLGTNDNFFELGGHSLKATILVSKMGKELNAEIPLSIVFKTPTIKEIAKYAMETEKSEYISIPTVEQKEYYPLSSAQRRLYILNQLEGGKTSYNVPIAMTIEGSLEKDSFIKAVEGLIIRHESLRTSFELLEGEPVQKIHQNTGICVDYIEMPYKNEDHINTVIRSFVKPFDLKEAPLLRAILIKAAEDRHIFFLDMHHIIADGTSVGIIVKDLIDLYNGKMLPDLRVNYKEFAAWQQGMYQTDAMKKQEEYWKNVFADEVSALNMPLDYARPLIQSVEGGSINFTIDAELTSKLTRIGSETGTTMYMILMAVYNILLSKYCRQDDIVVGTPVAGRQHVDLQNIIGMFVNTLAIRNKPQGVKTFMQFLKEVKQNSISAFQNQDYPFEELVEKLNISRDLARNPLFDTMFNMLNMDVPETKIEGLKFMPYSIESSVSKFDITLRASEAGETVNFNLEYCSSLFKRETMEGFKRHFINIIRQISENPEIKLSQIDLLSEDEKSMILFGFNSSVKEAPCAVTVVRMFEEQVERTPENIAAVYEGRVLTYRQLDQKANQLSRLLSENRIGTGSVIAILSEPSIEMLIGILGVMKAGGVYLPIDPEQPADRIQHILKDSEAEILLVQRHLLDKADFGGKAIELCEDSWQNYETSNLGYIVNPEDLAYIIYTSGTTGLPKGVMIENRNLVNYIEWFVKKAKLKNSDRTVYLSSFAFDLGYTALYPTITSGCELHIVSKELYLDPRKLLNFIKVNQITYIKLTPSLFGNIASAIEFGTGKECESLRLVVLGGEQINLYDVENFHKLYPSARVINHYGPTETTIGAIAYEIDFSKFDEYKKSPVIGYPIDNTRVYILDGDLKLVPVGIYGEICIAGSGLGRGYLNQKDLTASKFIRINLTGDKDELVYRTGDIGRYLADGSIQFAGRVDHQIKIRGYRVEVKEIEKRLLGYPLVTEAVVIIKNDQTGNKYLSAYIVGEKELKVSELREYMAKGLPEYMIPSSFTQMDKIPLTPNGKADIKALSGIDFCMSTGVEYVAPQNRTEERLVTIWQEILGTKKISSNDDFFQIGGHSLKATMLMYKIQKEFNISMPLREIFNNSVLCNLADYIIRKGPESNILSDENLIIIRKGSMEDKNIFFIHDGSGDIEAYVSLCNNLYPEYNYWGIRSDRFEAGPQNITVEDIAEKYVQKIRQIQQNEPYNIAGWSIGGTIAFETVRLFEQHGCEVGFFAMIDSMGPLEFYKGSLTEFTAESELELIKEYLPGRTVDDMDSLQDIWSSLYKEIDEKQIDADAVKKAIPENIANSISNFSQIGLKEVFCYINTLRTFRRARAQYIPSGMVNTPIHFFKATSSGHVDEYKWVDFCQKPLEVYNIKGDHYSIFRKPYIEELSKVFNEVLMNKLISKK